jgi:hypothetical protein
MTGYSTIVTSVLSGYQTITAIFFLEHSITGPVITPKSGCLARPFYKEKGHKTHFIHDQTFEVSSPNTRIEFLVTSVLSGYRILPDIELPVTG